MNQNQKSEIIRLSVVDDHPIVILGIQYICRKAKDFYVTFVNQYNSGYQVLEDLNCLDSDVLIIDMSLPDIKGYELARLVLDANPKIKIGIYSHMLDRESIVNSFKCGVLGYLPKSANSIEFIDFVLTISRGERYVRGLVADIIFESNNFFKKQQEVNITKREYEILKLILAGSKNREIAEKLSIAERTVEFHKQNIYIKLGVSNSVDLYKVTLRLDLLSMNDLAL